VETAQAKQRKQKARPKRTISAAGRAGGSQQRNRRCWAKRAGRLNCTPVPCASTAVPFCWARLRVRIGPAMDDLIYIRVSTEEQSDSLPVQEKKCRDFAQSQSLSVSHVFTDAESARTTGRPQLQAMLAFCRKNKGKIGNVIVADLSRLARNVADQSTLIATLAALNIRLRSVDEQHIDGSAGGKLIAGMTGVFNQYFSDSLSERTKYRMQAAVKSGRWVWKAVAGYTNSKTGAGSTIKLDPERAHLVRKGFELMSSSNYSADDVLRMVTALGLRNTKGTVLARQTFHAMLRNPLYAGWVKSGDVMERGIHPPIVTQQLFDTVQEVLAGRSKTSRTRQVLNPEFPLRQFIRCAACNKGLTAGIAKKKFPYYWCYTKGCRAVFVPAPELEIAFVGWIGQYEPTTEYLALLPDIAKEVWAKRQARAKQDSRALTIKLQEQKHLNSEAIKAKVKGELLAEDFDALKQSITEETARIEAALTALESERSTMEELIAQTQRELIDLPAAWAKAGLSERRELCSMLFPDGLVWSHSMGFLNSQNTSIMQDLCDSWLDDTDDVKFGVPDGI
jgi:site-specific DNA recombinase